MGDDAREASDREIEQMQEALVRAFDEGACGFSSGLVYVPAAYASTDEVAALCEVVAARDLPFFVHVRSESDRVVEATDEVIDVAARTGCHLHYSHIKAAGRHNWHKAAVLIDRIDAARGAGRAGVGRRPSLRRRLDERHRAAPALGAGRRPRGDAPASARPERAHAASPAADGGHDELGQLVVLLGRLERPAGGPGAPA